MSDGDAKTVVEAINKNFPNMEVGLIKGQQDVYDLLIGLY